MPETDWQTQGAGDWSDGVCWRVQSRLAGATTTTGGRWSTPTSPAENAFFVGEAEFDWAGRPSPGSVTSTGTETRPARRCAIRRRRRCGNGSAYLFYGPVFGTIDLPKPTPCSSVRCPTGSRAGGGPYAGDVNSDGRQTTWSGLRGTAASPLLTEPVHGIVDLGDGDGIDGARIERARRDAAGHCRRQLSRRRRLRRHRCRCAVARRRRGKPDDGCRLRPPRTARGRRRARLHDRGHVRQRAHPSRACHGRNQRRRRRWLRRSPPRTPASTRRRVRSPAWRD